MISDYAGDHQNSDKKEIKMKPQSWKLWWWRSQWYTCKLVTFQTENFAHLTYCFYIFRWSYLSKVTTWSFFSIKPLAYFSNITQIAVENIFEVDDTTSQIKCSDYRNNRLVHTWKLFSYRHAGKCCSKAWAIIPGFRQLYLRHVVEVLVGE